MPLAPTILSLSSRQLDAATVVHFLEPYLLKFLLSSRTLRAVRLVSARRCISHQAVGIAGGEHACLIFWHEAGTTVVLTGCGLMH